MPRSSKDKPRVWPAVQQQITMRKVFGRKANTMDFGLYAEWVSKHPKYVQICLLNMAQKRAHCAGGFTDCKSTRGLLKPCSPAILHEREMGTHEEELR